MTDAQFDALVVLANVRPGSWVHSSKRRSTSTPRPNVNNRAASALVGLGYAEARDRAMERAAAGRRAPSDVFVSTTDYRITGNGVRVVVREDRRRG